MYGFIALCVLGLGFYAVFLTAMFRDDWRRRRRSLRSPVGTVSLGTVFTMDTASRSTQKVAVSHHPNDVVMNFRRTSAGSGRA